MVMIQNMKKTDIFTDTITAFIPARKGSERIPDKNIKEFLGKPLLFRAIDIAERCRIFDHICVSSDSMLYLDMVHKYYPDVKIIHRKFPVDSLSPDIEWLEKAISHVERFHRATDYYAILRPTNPFRSPLSISKAFLKLIGNPDFDSLKAYTPCHTNPYKIFEIKKYDNTRSHMIPLLTDFPLAFTFPTQLFQHRTFGDQVGFLDICKWDNIRQFGNHFGDLIYPYEVNPIEALDINTELDWFIAEQLEKHGKVELYES